MLLVCPRRSRGQAGVRGVGTVFWRNGCALEQCSRGPLTTAVLEHGARPLEHRARPLEHRARGSSTALSVVLGGRARCSRVEHRARPLSTRCSRPLSTGALLRPSSTVLDPRARCYLRKTKTLEQARSYGRAGSRLVQHLSRCSSGSCGHIRWWTFSPEPQVHGGTCR